MTLTSMISQTCAQIVSTYSIFPVLHSDNPARHDLVHFTTGTGNRHAPKSLDAYTHAHTQILSHSQRY